METVEAARNSRVSKSKKKGGKAKMTAEDEARRKEAIQDALREKMELERRALQVVERLLEDRVTEESLLDCAWHISRANYRDTVEERSIAKLCGYPVCGDKLSHVPSQQFKISTKTNRVYDITERKCFCSNFCYKASKCFELQISQTPLWLRKKERPPEIKLMKNGARGSSGLEVRLVDKPVTEAEIESPIPDNPESRTDSSPFNQSDNSGDEDGFVSSVLSSEHKSARVHWGKLPTRDGLSVEEEEADHPVSSLRSDPDSKRNTHSNPDVESTVELLDHCTDLSVAQQDTSFSSQSENETYATSEATYDLSITQVGMSRRGAVDFKDLLKNHSKVQTIVPNTSLCLLDRLHQTFMEWRTEETMKFLYGPDYSPGTDFFVKEVEDQDEELDEDDFDDAKMEMSLTRSSCSIRPSNPPPNFETLRKDTEMLQLKVNEFYRGVCVPGDEAEVTPDTHDAEKDLPLPLVDSQAQNVIRKRIVVEKLSRSLRGILGPLRLTMNDVINDVKNLVRTFRLSSTNILHKSPEWDFISVVLLSVLTEVSPLLKETLVCPSSLKYISTLMRELKLKDQDLHNLVLLFKPRFMPQT